MPRKYKRWALSFLLISNLIKVLILAPLTVLVLDGLGVEQLKSLVDLAFDDLLTVLGKIGAVCQVEVSDEGSDLVFH